MGRPLHASTYVFVVMGLVVLWRAAGRTHFLWFGKVMTGTVLIGFGAFNLVKGIINHHLLGIHHVNETVARGLWMYWDLGFLLWGAFMLIAGWLLLRVGRATSEGQSHQ